MTPAAAAPAGRLECRRLFFALLPPPGAVAGIAALRDATGLRSPVRDERLHMTLLLGADRPDAEPATVDAFRAVGGAVPAGPVAVTLDRLVRGQGSAALAPAIASPALLALQATLAREAEAAGLPLRGDWRFAPHVTLGYRPAEREAGERAVPPVAWMADALVLVDSWVGLGRHDVLGRWPLAR